MNKNLQPKTDNKSTNSLNKKNKPVENKTNIVNMQVKINNKQSNIANNKANDTRINKSSKPKKTSSTSFFGNIIKKIKTKKFCVGFVATIILITMMTSVYAGLDSSIKTLAQRNVYLAQEARQSYNVDDNKSTTMVGYYGEQIGTVERNVPTITKDGGLSSGYPKYGYSLNSVLGTTSDKIAQRNALIGEANSLCATGTANAGGGGGYTWIDKNGYLYKDTTLSPTPALDKNNVHRKLYKHTASVGLYLGDVSDNEVGIVKRVTIRPRGYSGYSVTGLYAPAGEVIKVTISEQDMNATGGLTFHIGQALYNGQANNIWTDKNQMQRIPVLLNTLTLNKNTTTFNEETKTYTGYIGSFIGGPIYIRNANATYTATISGAVNYPHLILGYTTKAEFEEYLKSSAPYFDLEVWSYGVLHSGPKVYASSYSYEDLYKVANLWEKVSSVTTTGSSQGIVFLYDAFVAAGAAVAFPGRRSVNCPAGWMRDALNYNGIVNYGSWGNFHEYHHNFQGYGVGNGGEVTNNGMTLVSYALFTRISANRGLGNYGSAGLSGWNQYTCATLALDQTLRIKDNGASNGVQGLALYATLLHNFGADNYIKAKIKQQSSHYGENYVGYLRAWQETTHYDMTYYFRNLLTGSYIYTDNTDPNNPVQAVRNFGITDSVVQERKNESYPLFVPVSSVYQTGRSYTYDGIKKDIQTMQPYVIPYGENFTLDLRRYTLGAGNIYEGGSIILPNDFSFNVKATPVAEHGNIIETSTPNVYTYIPDPNYKTSGKIRVTLQLEKTASFANDVNFGNRQIDDVELILELEQSHEMNKNTLKRTTYTYSQNSCYTDAVTAFENNYEGYTSKEEKDNKNPTQNSNTDVWYNNTTDTVPLNSVVEVKGKMYVGETAKYRIQIRGRWNVALFVSLDGGRKYELAGSYKQTNTFSPNFPKDSSGNELVGTYKDYDLTAGSWVHFKAVMITGQDSASRASFVGIGWGKFIPEQGTINEDTGLVDNWQPEHVNVGYATAYRDTYQFTNNTFETDYMYKREYSYTYGNSYNTNKNQFSDIKFVNTDDTDASNPNKNAFASNSKGENLIDNDVNNICASPDLVSTTKPWIFTIDLGKEITANRFVLEGNLFNNSSNKNQTPSSVTLWLGNNLNNMQEVTPQNISLSGTTLAFNFDLTTFRYYKLEVKRTVEGRFGAIRSINFSYSITGKQQSLDNDIFTLHGSWKGKQVNSYFGHVYVGKSHSYVTFNFTGTRIAILSSTSMDRNFMVLIDGNAYYSEDIANSGGVTEISYLSKQFENKNHSVIIVCYGEANIDSIVTF